MSVKTRPIRVVREQIANLRISINSQDTNSKIAAENLKASTATLAAARVVHNEAQEADRKEHNITKAFSDKLAGLLAEEAAINTAVARTPTVSDHALIRYIERVMNFDVDQIRRSIIGRDSGTIKKMDDGEISRDEYSLVVKNSTVVTVIK